MDPQRQKMLAVIKEQVVPMLRELGFRGSFPHFRRIGSSQIDLLSIQFYSSGGSFVVEVAKCPKDGFTTGWGEQIPPNKVNVTYLSERLRLGSDLSTGQADHWYVFGLRNYDAGYPELKPDSLYRRLAEDVIADVKTQAVPWWAKE